MDLKFASFICKCQAEGFFWIALSGIASRRFFGAKNRFIQICPPNAYLGVSAIFKSASYSIDSGFVPYLITKFKVRYQIGKCPSCRKIERFVIRANLDRNSPNCSICLEATNLGQRIAVHHRGGDRHPIHENCFNQLIRPRLV